MDIAIYYDANATLQHILSLGLHLSVGYDADEKVWMAEVEDDTTTGFATHRTSFSKAVVFAIADYNAKKAKGES